MTEIKPCPFCGSDQIKWHRTAMSPRRSLIGVYHISLYCYDCNATGPRHIYLTNEKCNKEEIIKAWNTRK